MTLTAEDGADGGRARDRREPGRRVLHSAAPRPGDRLRPALKSGEIRRRRRSV
ncbi:hypothetical protein HMPREF0043_01416 [Actinobaculum sp. oral taxon 183 str. F0552]|nr:hypothetical protein HMPREF0043_01416 [Actinobaculum sp. oral taxon 183 str. F0552]